MQGLRRNSALFPAPEKAGVRQPILILPPLCLDIPENARAFCCNLCNFAFAGKSFTPLPPMDHGSMSRIMFGLTKATRPPRKMRQRMRQKCVCCVVRSAPPSQFVMSVKSTIVLNVLTPTLVGAMLFIQYNTNDSWSG